MSTIIEVTGREIMDSLSPAGLSIHLRADSIQEGRSVMAQVRALAGK